MKKSTYTRTALASLLTLCSFSCFAAEFPSENMREIKKQESTNISGKLEVMKTSNTKLKEKMDRICNAVPRKKAEEVKKKENAKLVAEQEKRDEIRLASEKKKAEEMRLANEKSAKLKDDQAKSRISKENAKKDKALSIKESKTKDVKDSIKSTINKSVERKAKANPVVSVGDVDIIDTNQGKSGLRITFGGVVDAQGYGKASPNDNNYNRYNVMTGRSTNYYEVAPDKVKRANPIFPRGIGNIGDYSDKTGMVADAILHLRAENKNEDLGLLYGADVQFHVPVTEGKGASQGVYAARGRGAHIFVNSEYGDVKLGYQFGPESLMRLDATRIATADGAADSNWYRKVNLEGIAASFPFYVTPRLYTESFSSESEKLSFRMAGMYNKGFMTTLPFRVAYYSPNYMGARFGVSYAPRYESNLFSVSDSVIPGNPYTAEIDNITNKFLEAGKITVPTDKDDAAIKTLATASNISGNNITNIGRSAALGAIAADLDAALALKTDSDIKGDTKVTRYKTSYSARDSDIDAAAKAAIMTKPTGYNTAELKAKIEAKLTTRAGTDLPVSEVTKAVNDVLADIKKLDNSGKKSDVRNAVEAAFKDGVFSNIINGPWNGENNIRHVYPGYQNILSAGVSYDYDFDEYKVKIKASAVGEWAQAKKPSAGKHIYNEYVEYNDLTGVNFGISANYKIDEDQSAKFAASFAYLGKSGQPKDIQTLGSGEYTKLSDTNRVEGLKQFDGNTMYWTAGAGYQYENAYTSLTYFGSTMNDGDQLHDIALGVQYDLSPACSKSKFIPYAALHYFMTDEKGNNIMLVDKKTAPPSNKGALLLTGVKFSF